MEGSSKASELPQRHDLPHPPASIAGTVKDILVNIKAETVWYKTTVPVIDYQIC